MPRWHRRLIIWPLLLSSSLSFAKDVTVFDVRRPLSMNDNDNPPKDYYLNAGEADGLKPGVVVTVKRRHALYDQYQSKSPGDLIVAVGQLRIIYVQSDVSVARLEKVLDRNNLPTLEFDAIMVGDKVDLSTARAAGKSRAALDDHEEKQSVAVATPAEATAKTSKLEDAAISAPFAAPQPIMPAAQVPAAQSPVSPQVPVMEPAPVPAQNKDVSSNISSGQEKTSLPL